MKLLSFFTISHDNKPCLRMRSCCNFSRFNKIGHALLFRQSSNISNQHISFCVFLIKHFNRNIFAVKWLNGIMDNTNLLFRNFKILCQVFLDHFSHSNNFCISICQLSQFLLVSECVVCIRNFYDTLWCNKFSIESSHPMMGVDNGNLFLIYNSFYWTTAFQHIHRIFACNVWD